LQKSPYGRAPVLLPIASAVARRRGEAEGSAETAAAVSAREAAAARYASEGLVRATGRGRSSRSSEIGTGRKNNPPRPFENKPRRDEQREEKQKKASSGHSVGYSSTIFYNQSRKR